MIEIIILLSIGITIGMLLSKIIGAYSNKCKHEYKPIGSRLVTVYQKEGDKLPINRETYITYQCSKCKHIDIKKIDGLLAQGIEFKNNNDY